MSSSSEPTADLRSWLVLQHQAFTEQFNLGDLKNWIICVGNEAGDLDTLASSIAFAYLASFANPPIGPTDRRYLPVQQTKSTDFHMRPENVEALKLANLLDGDQKLPMAELVCSDRVDLSKLTSYGAKYALVDHNRINSAVFGSSAEVVAVIDHHQAEENDSLYRSSNPRLIKVPTGSCASLVTDYFSVTYSSTQIPRQLADLLLSAIAIDTKKFKPADQDGKATTADLEARDWLWPRSTFSQSNLSSLSSATSGFDAYYKQLSNLKKDVSQLDSAQLLARDYKQSEIDGWWLGISSVPVGLEVWVQEKTDGDWSKFLDALKEYAEGKKLDVASVLTSALKKKELASQSAPAKPGRRLVLLATGAHVERISKLFVDHQATLLESDLSLTPFETQSQASIDKWAVDHQASVRIFNVENLSVTRKQVSPVLTDWIKKLGPKL